MPDFVTCYGNVKKKPLPSTVGLLSKTVCISCIIDSNWAILESPPPTWKKINIYQKYPSPVPAFSQSTICCLIKNKKIKIFHWADFFLMWA